MNTAFLARKSVSRTIICIIAIAAVVCPALATDRTTPVTVTGTPSVTVTNAPTVSISATNNVVQTATKSSVVQLWTSDQVLSNNGYATSSIIDCTGYKEVRVVLFANSSSTNLTAKVAFGTPFIAGYMSLGYANFATPTVPSANQGNFQPYPTGNCCYFAHPVLSNSCIVMVSNNTGGSVTVSKNCWVYLIN